MHSSPSPDVEIEDPSRLFPMIRERSEAGVLAAIRDTKLAVDTRLAVLNRLMTLNEDPMRTLELLLIPLAESLPSLRKWTLRHLEPAFWHPPFVEKIPTPLRLRVLDALRKLPTMTQTARARLGDVSLVEECRERMRVGQTLPEDMKALAIIRCEESIVVMAEVFARRFPDDVKQWAAIGLAMAGNRTSEAWLKHWHATAEFTPPECLMGLCVLDRSCVPAMLKRYQGVDWLLERSYQAYRLTPPSLPNTTPDG